MVRGPAIAICLVLWARATAAQVGLPPLENRALGAGLLLTGLALLVLGLPYHGGVRRSQRESGRRSSPSVRTIHRITRLPVHAGLGASVFGLSLMTGSASGLWLVTPITALALAAWAYGYARHQPWSPLQDSSLPPPLLRLPPDDDGLPTPWGRWSVVILVFVPWTLAYEAVFLLGIPPDGIEAALPFEKSWPVLVWTEAIYTSAYVIVLAATFGARHNRVLRHLSLTALTATVVVPLIYITIPVISPPRPFASSSVLGTMLEMERAMSHTAAAFPAFHVIWTLIAAEALAATYPRVAAGAWIWALAISVSCITTGMHAIVDVLFAAALWTLLRSYSRVWDLTRRAAKTSREWRLGPLRLVDHSLSVALTVALASWIAISLAGPVARPSVLSIALAALASWASMSRLKRTSRWSGSSDASALAVGALAGMTIGAILGWPIMLPLAAVATAAPWIPALARAGDPLRPDSGTRPILGPTEVPEPAIAPWGRLVFGSVVIGALLARMWKLGAALSLIAGLYLILTGLLRFVDTPVRTNAGDSPGGVAPHQRSAIIWFVVGAIVVGLPSAGAPDSSGWLSPVTVVAACVLGSLALVAAGVTDPGRATPG